VSEEKGSKGTLLSEDRLSVKTFADTNHNTTRYFAEIEINGKRITSEKHESLDVFKDFERTIENLYRKAEILKELNSPRAADALAEDMLNDIAELVLLTRALLDKTKSWRLWKSQEPNL
jgi:hypothetical protein